MKRSLVIAPLFAALLALSACADSDQENRALNSAESTSTADNPDAAEAADSTAVLGTVEVADMTYDITQVRRCEPAVQDMLERDLELQGLGEHGGQHIQIDVYVQKIGGMPADDVAWAGPEGIFGGPEDAAVSFSGDRVSGTATLLEGTAMEDTLSVSFDLAVPAETLQCR